MVPTEPKAYETTKLLELSNYLIILPKIYEVFNYERLIIELRVHRKKGSSQTRGR
jgi:hypothetical protein